MHRLVVIIIGLFFILGTVIQTSGFDKKQPKDFGGNPDKFILNQNYPNPFNPTTIISYSLKTDARVKLTIYNLVGQSVQVLVDGFQGTGDYEVNFDASDLPSGIYLYKLQVGDYSSVKRMTLVK